MVKGPLPAAAMTARPVHLLLAAALTASACAAACGDRSAGAAQPDALTWDQVLAFKDARDYFALRARLEAAPTDSGPPAVFGRALVEHAFNRPAVSNRIIAGLIGRGSLPDSLVADLRQIEMDNALRLFHYRAGLEAADALLGDTAGLDSGSLRDARNTRRIFAALADVPPQTIAVQGPSSVRFRQGRVPVTINDSLRHYVFDTGANLSTLMRSEARALGLDLRPAGIDVGTSTDRRVVADLGVAGRLAIGAMEFRNVVFLVLDDSLLSFPGGFRIPGIVGFPVIEQMGEVHLYGNDSLFVPAGPPRRGERNLALSGLTMLTPVGWAGDTLLCRLDTGAEGSDLYYPFYVRRRARIDSLSEPRTRRSGGAGGIRELAVRRLDDVRLTVGDTTVHLDSVDVLTRSIVSHERADYLDCNLGHDVLDAFSEYVVSFRDMAFLLR